MTVFLTDAVLMSWVGVKQLAAVDLSAMIAGILMLLVMAISTAATSLVARHIGAGKRAEAELFAGQSLIVGFCVSVLLALPVIAFAPGLLLLMGLEPSVAAFGVTYLRTVMWAAGLRQIITTGCGILRGAGDTRTPMFITLLMNVVNTTLAVFLIFGLGPFPRLEVFGAALAANVAALVGASVVLAVLFHGRRFIKVHLRDIIRIHRPAIALLLRIGLPAGLEMFATRIGFLLYYRIIASLGTEALAANAIALRIESLSFMPGMGIATAAMTLVGQTLGSGQVALAEKSMRRCTLIAAGLMSFLGLVCLAAARPMASLFVSDEHVVYLSALCIQVAAFEQPLLGFVMVQMGGLRGAGDTLTAMVVSLIGSTFVRVPLVFLLARTLGLGLVGAWVGALVDWAIRGAVLYLLVRRGRWKRIRVELPPTLSPQAEERAI
jgi:putative MATE family efflux protein